MVFAIIVVHICFGKTTQNQPSASQQGVLKMLKIWECGTIYSPKRKGCYYEINPNEPQSEGYGDNKIDGAV